MPYLVTRSSSASFELSTTQNAVHSDDQHCNIRSLSTCIDVGSITTQDFTRLLNIKLPIQAIVDINMPDRPLLYAYESDCLQIIPDSLVVTSRCVQRCPLRQLACHGYRNY